MRQVFLAGAFGQGNPGDDALLEAFAAGLPRCRVVAACDDPESVPSPARDDVTLVAKTARGVARELVRSDAVVYAGGTVFKQLGPGTGRHPHALLLRALVLARVARAAGKPVVLAGVGVGALPSRRARRLARSLVQAADLVIVRDEESAAALARAGAGEVRVGADAAWTLVDPVPPVEAHDGRLVITLSRHAGGRQSAAALGEAVARWVRARPDITSVHIEPWQLGGPGEDDHALALAMHRALRDVPQPCVVDPPPRSVCAAARSYHGAALVLGARFHSLLAAGAAGRRFVAVAHEAKLAALARRLGQRAVPLRADDVPAALDAAMRGPAPARAVIDAERAAAHDMLAEVSAVVGTQCSRRTV